MFYENIKNIKRVDKRSNEELCALAQTGDKKAEEALVLNNLKLIINIAKKFNYYQFTLPELVNQGIIGFYVGIERFQTDRGCKFSTYVTGWIYNKISLYVKNNSRAARYPLTLISSSLKVNKYINNFVKKFNYYPSNDEICNEFQIKPSKLQTMSALFNPDYSLDKEVDKSNDDSYGLELKVDASYKQEPSKALAKENIEFLDDALKTLKASEQKFIKSKYGIGRYKKLTLKQLAEKNKLSMKGVYDMNSQIHKKLFEILSNVESS